MAEPLGLQNEIQILKKEYVEALRCETALAGAYPRNGISLVSRSLATIIIKASVYRTSRANTLALLFIGFAVYEQSLLSVVSRTALL